MMLQVSKYIATLFGLFIVLVGFLMLFNPKKSRMVLAKFASTNLINYTEITLRLIVGLALVVVADICKSPVTFKTLGWFMIITAIILYCVPRKLHHRFSQKSADVLKPRYFRLISPFAFLFGGLIIYNLNLI